MQKRKKEEEKEGKKGRKGRRKKEGKEEKKKEEGSNIFNGLSSNRHKLQIIAADKTFIPSLVGTFLPSFLPSIPACLWSPSGYVRLSTDFSFLPAIARGIFSLRVAAWLL
eukprot:GHVT01033335.1.p2 GENE.GHVT01033335.1~~GHVT01033335.1.p2  ORF type:complete len:110 (+),score=31.34 GHVT01033335.1:591-920(+)